MRPLRILIACECSGEVRQAFRSLGHRAWSCDLLPSEDNSTYHFCGDVRNWITPTWLEEWDAVIAFPPCTDLCVSGARHFAAKRADGRQQAAIEFFRLFTDLPIPTAIENPVGIMSSLWRKPEQIIQPWQFGHCEAKKTCLWLKGLPSLVPTGFIPKPACGYYDNQTPSGQNKLGPSSTRAADRSRTYPGIAQAMATQWSAYLLAQQTE